MAAFLGKCPDEILAQYLETILGTVEVFLGPKISELVQQTRFRTIEELLKIIEAVTDSKSANLFLPFYEKYAPQNFANYFLSN